MTPTLRTLTWRKSSRSGPQGDDCVELAALSWQKSSRSGAQGDTCVEVAAAQQCVVVGDTKAHAALALALGAQMQPLTEALR